MLSVAAGECHILNLAIHPDWQGRGLGRKLMNRLLGLARQHQADTAFLEVRESNEAALALYRSMGFNEVGLRRSYYPALGGREDALVFPNFQSRAYYALNQLTEGSKSKLSYIEVTPAQHFDAFISLLWPLGSGSGLVEFVPLHYYLTEGLERMLNHLLYGNPLWPSQVVRATPRLDQPYPIAPLPKLPVDDPGTDAIVFSNGILRIPK